MAKARRHVQSIGINPDPFSRSESARWPSGLKNPVADDQLMEQHTTEVGEEGQE